MKLNKIEDVLGWLFGKTRGAVGLIVGWLLLSILFYVVADKLLWSRPELVFWTREVLLWGIIVLLAFSTLLLPVFLMRRWRGVVLGCLRDWLITLIVSAYASGLLCGMSLPMVGAPSEEWVKANLSSCVEVSYADLTFIAGKGERNFPSSLYEVKDPNPRCLQGVELEKCPANADYVLGSVFKDNGIRLSREHHLVLLYRDYRKGQDIWGIVDRGRTFLYAHQWTGQNIFSRLFAVFQPSYYGR